MKFFESDQGRLEFGYLMIAFGLIMVITPLFDVNAFMVLGGTMLGVGLLQMIHGIARKTVEYKTHKHN